MSKDFEERLKVVEDAIDSFYGKVKEGKKREYSLLTEIEMYNDPSVNPNGNYDTDRAIVDGEKPYCESLGYHWEDWCEISSLYKEYQYLMIQNYKWKEFLQKKHPLIWEELDNL